MYKSFSPECLRDFNSAIIDEKYLRCFFLRFKVWSDEIGIVLRLFTPSSFLFTFRTWETSAGLGEQYVMDEAY